MGPEKTAKVFLVCDGCGDLMTPGQKYAVDGSGYLLCLECKASGDLPQKAV